MDVRAHNRRAWDRCVEDGNRWTRPVESEVIDRAREGDFQLLLTPTRSVPLEWFPSLPQTRTLCLASAGGQQGPVLAAAGARVTVLDNSPRQLAQDRSVAERDGLALELIEGDMTDMVRLSDDAFDLIFHPCANCFVADVIPVWRECFRVLASGGVLLAGFVNPVRYIFDDERAENASLEVRYSLPYSDLDDLPPDQVKRLVDAEQALEFGHSLEDQIGGQISAGFLLTGFYEDRYPAESNDPISKFMPTFMATRSLKP